MKIAEESGWIDANGDFRRDGQYDHSGKEIPIKRYVPLDIAETLERELAEAKAEIAAKSEQWRMSSACREMKEQAGRLAGALEALLDNLKQHGNTGAGITPLFKARKELAAWKEGKQ